MTRAGAVDAPVVGVPTAAGRVGLRTVGAGSPLLLLTGFGTTVDHWPPDLVDALAATHRVLLADPPGVGVSEMPASPLSVAVMAEQAAALVDGLAVGPVAVLGWSMGGMVAQRLAVARPDLVRALVLVAAAPGVVGAVGPTSAGRAALAGHDPKALLAALFPDDRAGAAAYTAGIARYPQRHGVHGHGVADDVRSAQTRAVLEWRAGHDPDGALIADTAVPVLLVAGGCDPIDPPANHELLAGLLPSARSVVDAGAGHGVAFRDPPASAALVERFLGPVRG